MPREISGGDPELGEVNTRSRQIRTCSSDQRERPERCSWTK